MRLPNGFGGVHKLSGKRRKPWRARVTSGWFYDEKKQKLVQKFVTLGYYESRQKAYSALTDYAENNFVLENYDVTVRDLYERWSSEYFKTLSSATSIRTVEAAWRYCDMIKNIKARDIRAYHLKECIDKASAICLVGKDKGKTIPASPTIKSRMKSLFNLMFDYAVEHEYARQNFARSFHLSKDVEEQKLKEKKKIVVFSREEILKLWELLDVVPFTDMVLIQIYSGWRPQELAILKVADIDLDSGFMVGGMKTKAGRGRKVPIHPEIRCLIEKRMKEASVLNSEFLFNDVKSQTGMHMTYDKYKDRFRKVMDVLQAKHRPHECRHTFITLAKESEVDEYVLKLIVGHNISDITEGVYTHRTLDTFVSEIQKIKIKEKEGH